MKMKKMYMYSAVISAVLKFYDVHEIAEATAEMLKEVTGGANEFDVYNAKSDGFVLRKRKDSSVSFADMHKSFYKTIRKLVEDEDDGITSYMYDQYDVKYDKDEVNSDFSEYILDITTNGRLITFVLDIA